MSILIKTSNKKNNEFETNIHSINNDHKIESKSPIPPPNHPKQYRAIGLIYGKYNNINPELTRGFIATKEGKIIDAVLLGRIFCLIKKHLNLEKEHLWVVYPRMNQDNQQFHAQIVGVWQPEILNKNSPISLNTSEKLPFEHGYFSIRGEVIFYAKEEQKVIIKIVQLPSKKSPQPNIFKLKLTGILPNDSLGHFFDLDVSLEDNNLVIKKANDLGLLPWKKVFNNKQSLPNNRGIKNTITPPKIKKGKHRGITPTTQWL